MKIWSRKKLSTKRDAEEKSFLQEQLRSYTWKRDPTSEENAQAVETLPRILRYLRETLKGPKTVSASACSGRVRWFT